MFLVIEKREMEWFARQQLRMEKHRRRQNEVEDWNNDGEHRTIM